jgi:signal peptidase II
MKFPDRIPRLAWAAYGFALAIIALDQLSKAYILSGLELRDVGRVFVFPPVFNISYVENRAASFGLGGGAGRWGLSLFALIATGGLAWWATQADRRLLVTAIGFVIGGALGNVIDRMRLGYVVDFLDFSGTGVFPWVFNVADIAVTVGVALLILDTVLSDRKAAQVGVVHEKS